jgi:hypothetical protein
MSLFPLLFYDANRIKRLQWDFLWGGIGDSSNSTCLAGLRFVLRSLKEGWSPTELLWRSGFSVMFMRERSCGGW